MLVRPLLSWQLLISQALWHPLKVFFLHFREPPYPGSTPYSLQHSHQCCLLPSLKWYSFQGHDLSFHYALTWEIPTTVMATNTICTLITPDIRSLYRPSEPQTHVMHRLPAISHSDVPKTLTCKPKY